MWGAIQRGVKHPKARALLDHPFLFRGVRFFLVGRQRDTKRHLRAFLAQSPGTRVLDVCCGLGDFAGVVSGEYVGIDANPRFIRFAQRRYAKALHRRFSVDDATQMHFAQDAFDTTLFINAMHHFPTDFVRRILREMARVTKGQLIVFDMDPCQGPWWQRAIMACDRGDHARPLAEQQALLEEHFAITDQAVYTSGFIVQTVFRCVPRSAGGLALADASTSQQEGAR